MGTPLATRSNQPEARIVDESGLPRHPSTGAPQVTDPTNTRQPTGKKAELIAKCEARGIDVPSKATVADLKRLLGPEMAMAWYGRPSSLGKQIENTTNLQKWAERAVALGVFLDPSIVQELATVDPDQLNLDDAEVRHLLDTAAIAAKNTAQAGIAADRGTHTHALTEDVDSERDWIERARAGEDLGLTIEAQTALVAAWERMLERNELEILHTEAVVVDDRWRQAGTLDRIARLGKGLTFVTEHGEIVCIPGGSVIVLDIKSGRLRADRGIVQFWHSYAVQIASYAQSVPYDPATGQRGEWGFDIDQRWALIAHLDVRAALEGAAACRLVLVDLEAGREAGELCVAARRWEKRTDVFSMITDDDDTLVVVDVPASPPEAVPAADDADTSTPVPATGVEVSPPTDRHRWSGIELPESFAVKVAGVSFAIGYPHSIIELEVGADVELRREPSNEHDANAVAVIVQHPQKRQYPVGHLPAEIAAQLAPKMDAGIEPLASVSEVRVSPDHPHRPGLWINVELTKQSATASPPTDRFTTPIPPAGVDVDAAEWSQALAESIAGWNIDLRRHLAAAWPDGVATPGAVRRGDVVWSVDEMVGPIAAVVDQIVGPFDDAPAELMNRQRGQAVLAEMAASDWRASLNAWVAPIPANERRWSRTLLDAGDGTAIAIAQLALRVAELIAGAHDDPDAVAFVHAVFTEAGRPRHHTLAEAFNSLSVDGATSVHHVCAALESGRLALSFSDDGTPSLVENAATPVA